MLTLAVATKAETFDRIRDPLADRGIEVRHLRTRERTLHLTDPPWDADAFDAGFVYPPRLMEGGAADAMVAVPWVNGRDAILTSRNKGEVIARLSRAGIPVPETVMVSNPAEEDDVLAAFDRLEAPVVVKPNSTTRGIGVAKVADPDSLSGVTDYLDLVHDFRATGDRSYLLQEYLPGATDYRVMVVGGEYVGAVERRLPEDAVAAGQWKHNVHRGAEAEGVTPPAELRDLAEEVAATLDVDFLGVDLLVTDDRVVVSETNARPTVDAATKYEPDFYDRLATLVGETAENG